MSINKRAIFSGALGATASFIAKLALAPDSPVTSAVHNICTTKVHVVVEKTINNDIPPWFCPTVSLASRGICLLFMIGMNAFMISTFLDGMDESGSVVGTALSTAANFCCSVSFYIGIRYTSLPALEIYKGKNFHRLSRQILPDARIRNSVKGNVWDYILRRGRTTNLVFGCDTNSHWNVAIVSSKSD